MKPVINTGAEQLRDLALSTMRPVAIGEFPDSNKIMAYVGTSMNKELQHITRADQPADDFEGGPSP